MAEETYYDETTKMEGYETWTPDDLADYFETKGLGDYREVLINHKITGRIASQLTNEDLKDMGVEIVGDRCRFRHVIKSMGRKARHIQRNKILWDGKEQLWFNTCEGCVNTCCFLIPEDPSTYKLTNNHLKIKTVEPLRIGPLRLPCCNQYSHNNVDLTKVDDVDMENVPPPFLLQCLCCANGKEIIEIEAEGEGVLKLIVAQGDGETVSGLIMNQVEESQLIERE